MNMSIVRFDPCDGFSMMGKDLERGLANLKALVAG